MNSETGKTYEGDEVVAAMLRGEPLVPVSMRAAKIIKQMRNARAQTLKRRRRKRDAMQRASRRANR